MLSRILYLCIVALLAWNFGGAAMWFLERFLPFVWAGIVSIAPKEGPPRDATFWLNFAVGMIFFWVLLKLTGLSFGFMLPLGQRFGTTKLVRRIQGVMAEVILFFVVFAALFGLLILTPAGNDLIARRFLANPFLLNGDPNAKPIRYSDEGYDDTLNIIKGMLYQGIYFDQDALFSNQFGKARGEWLGKIFPAFWKQVLFVSLLLYILIQWAIIKAPAEGIYKHLLRFFEIGRFGIGGSGRFAGLIEEWAHRFKPGQGSLFLGRSLYNRFLNIGIKDDRHMLTIAGSRTGKNAAVQITNLLMWEGSCVVIDPKGTNAAVTARRRREMGQDVYIIDPFHVLGEETTTFNPLAGLDPKSRTIREEIAVIADALVVPDPGAKNAQHWEDGARTVLAGLIAHLIVVSKQDGKVPTLPLIREMLLLDGDDQLGLWVDMKNNRGAGDAAHDAALRISRGIETEEIRNILSNADKHSEWLSYPATNAALQGNDFKFSELKRKPVTVYLVIPPRFLDVHRRFLRLFINLAILEMSVGGKSRVPVLMILDEFLALGKMNEVERAFRLMAGYNLILWPFVQDYGGLMQLYGNSVNAFVTNSRAVQVFGVDDTNTLKFVSEHLGDRSMQWVKSVGDTLRITPLRTPKEISIEINKDHGLQYILRTGKAPLIAEKVNYFEQGWKPEKMPAWMTRRAWPFDGLYDADPDYRR